MMITIKRSIACYFLSCLFLFSPLSISAWVVGNPPFSSTIGITDRSCFQRQSSTACPMVFGDWFKFPNPNSNKDEEKKEEKKEEPPEPPKVEEPKSDTTETSAAEISATAVAEKEEPKQETAPVVNETAEAAKPQQSPDDSVELGVVQHGMCRWFNSRLGYGFVNTLNENGEVIPTPNANPGDSEEDQGGFFVHQSSIEMEGFRKLKVGQKVTFIGQMDEKGRYLAVNVRPEPIAK